MTRVRRKSDLRLWLMVSLLLHSLMLALPARLFQVVFPEESVEVGYGSSDLTPDFQEIAFGVVEIPVEVPLPTPPAEETEPADKAPVPEHARRMGGDHDSRRSGAQGEGESHADTRFFPPIPRLIVPPNIENLEVSILKVNIRILVGADGRPKEIELPDTLSHGEIRRRVLESAARFRFEPARMGDLPVAAWIDLPLEFEATGSR
jgi:outer membrane biosynthesis protein TonB